MNPAPVHILTHPLIQHKLTLLRQPQTASAQFRQLLHEISMLMAYELTRHLPLEAIAIQTPLEPMQGQQMQGKKLALISVLRAGNGLLDGMLTVLPCARVGHIGVYRDPATLQAVDYYQKLPPALPERDVIVLDPMLATGNSAIAALDKIASHRPKSLQFACLVACPEGIAALQAAHPQVPITTCAIDRQLNAHGYILPGLGDAGDRIYGT